MSAPDDPYGPPSDEERRPYFSEVGPEERAPAEQERVRPAGVVGGIVVGLLMSFALPFVLGSLIPTPLGLWLAVGLIALAGVAALVVPRWRRVGAGFVMGLAIGAIVFAGVCGAFLLSLSAQISPGG